MLSADNVQQTFFACLFADKDLVDGLPTGFVHGQQEGERYVIVRGVMLQIGFDRQRLEAQRDTIRSYLQELPDSFGNGKGGASFLEMCMTKSGEQWGEHQNCDELLCLGASNENDQLPLAA